LVCFTKPLFLFATEFDLGAALMKQVKTAANRGVQHYQHWLYATFWQDNPVAEGYLG
jgi:hypothetical protein